MANLFGSGFNPETGAFTLTHQQFTGVIAKPILRDRPITANAMRLFDYQEANAVGRFELGLLNQYKHIGQGRKREWIPKGTVTNTRREGRVSNIEFMQSLFPQDFRDAKWENLLDKDDTDAYSEEGNRIVEMLMQMALGAMQSNIFTTAMAASHPDLPALGERSFVQGGERNRTIDPAITDAINTLNAALPSYARKISLSEFADFHELISIGYFQDIANPVSGWLSILDQIANGSAPAYFTAADDLTAIQNANNGAILPDADYQASTGKYVGDAKQALQDVLDKASVELKEVAQSEDPTQRAIFLVSDDIFYKYRNELQELDAAGYGATATLTREFVGAQDGNSPVVNTGSVLQLDGIPVMRFTEFQNFDRYAGVKRSRILLTARENLCIGYKSADVLTNGLPYGFSAQISDLVRDKGRLDWHGYASVGGELKFTNLMSYARSNNIYNI